MAVDHIRYDLLAQEALRGVVQRVLADVAKNGFPGEHHLYITFDTRAAGVRVSPRLRELYPEDMTIVLQHQFWDLIVTEDEFEVGLSFGGIPERLVVPFSAIKSFFDPSVQFGLTFEPAETEAAAATNLPAAPSPAAVAVPPSSASPVAAEPADEPAKPSEGAEVVRLDRFRKK